MSTEQKKQPEIGLGITVGVLSALLVYVFIAWLLWQIPFPYELAGFKQHLMYWSAMELNAWLPPLMQSTADQYRYFLQHLPPGYSPNAIHFRFYLAGALGISVGIYLGWLSAKPEGMVRHVKGRQLKEGKQANNVAQSQSKTERKHSGDGLRLHPSFKWNLSLDRERRHIFVMGASGSGKTTILTPMMAAAIARGDQLVVYDNKGDFTEWMGNSVLLAPWDARSHALDIAKDCRNAQQARELAVHLVPAGQDPIWHQAARQVLTALIIKLQVEKPETWNWHDLYLLVCRSHKELLSFMKTYTPEASNILEAPDKTAQSVLMHLSTNAWLIADLAKAWGGATADKRFSVTDWIRGVDIKEKVLILQGSENYKVLSNAYIQLVFSLASGLINSPEIAKSNERRLWFFMDEFPQLGKLERFRSLLEIGRSKGIRIVLACQDIAQIREIYGEHAANSWLGIVGTYIFTRMGAGETANYVAEKMVGTRVIDRTVPHNNEKSATVRETELVIQPFELNDKLGANKNGVSALVLGVRDGLILNWPYTNTKKVREGSELASWLDHGHAKYSAEASTEIVDQPGTPRLKLRKPTDKQLQQMASSGSDLFDAGEDVDDMTSEAMGDHHEPH
jgi:hypothetical protein